MHDLQKPLLTTCRIVAVERRRDGHFRYWCLEHKADATAKYGRRAARCRYADTPPISPSESVTIEPHEYGGGVAIWGAVPPIYDTTGIQWSAGFMYTPDEPQTVQRK